MVHPLLPKEEWSLNTPSGWLGWARLLALVQSDTGMPILNQAHARYIQTHTEMLVEVLYVANRPVP